MYDVGKMKSSIENAVSIAKNEVRMQFTGAFKTIYAGNTVPKDLDVFRVGIESHMLKTRCDLDAIPYGEGFYIILSSCEVSGNDCCLTASGLRAIYRGECSTVKKRIQSHLFNTSYKSDYEQRKLEYTTNPKNQGRDFYESYWPHCLKIDPRVSGIDIDSEQYRQFDWRVIVHLMKDSSQVVREQAELAFDDVFGKPKASREKG